MSLRNSILAGSLVALNGCSNGGELADHNRPPKVPSQAVRDLEESTEQFLSLSRGITQRKAVAMLKAEGLTAEAENYPTTDAQVVFLGPNPFVGQGTYLPMEYQGNQTEYKDVMALRPYGVSAIANNDSNCLIVDGDPKTEPLLRGC